MKRLSLLFLVLLFSSCGTVQEKTSLVFLQKENAFYEKGYKEGYKKGVLEGKKEVWERVKDNLKLWEKDVLALEAGKVALERGYITQPVLFREKDGVVVSKPKLVLSKVEELLKLFVPTYEREKGVGEKGKSGETPLSVPSSLPAWAKVPFKEGFEKGYGEGLKEGRKEGIEEVREFERGRLFRDFFLKEEERKYYVRDYLITYPRLYKVVEGNRVKVVIIPPQIEGIRKSLLDLKVPIPEKETKKEETGGIVLPNTSSPYYFYGSSPSLKRVKVRCSQELANWGVPFVEEGNGKCEVLLPEGKVRDFCLKTKLCR